MSTKKISALTELTTTPAVGDLFPIVDISATTDAASGTTKSIKPATVFKAAGIGAGSTTAEPVAVDTSNGRLGVGTGSPAGPLHVSSTSADTLSLTRATDISGNGTGVAAKLQMGALSGSSNSFAAAITGTLLDSDGAGGGTNTEGYMSFLTKETGGSLSEKMRIIEDGNVGIGTTAPATLLEVSSTDAASVEIRVTAATNQDSKLDLYGDRDWSIMNVGSGSGGFVDGIFIYDVTGGATRMAIDTSGNVLIGGLATPTSSVGNLCLFNGTAPAASIANGVVLYAEDATSSSELKVRDEAGNISTLSPHNFDLLGDRSEPMAWSYSAKNAFVGKEIAVDMTKVIRALEKLTGESYIKIRDIDDSEKLDWATEQKKYEAEQKKNIDAYKAKKAESDAHPTNSSTKAEIKTFLDEKGISYADAPKDELFAKVPKKEAFTETEPAAYSKKSKPSWIG